MTKIVKFIHSFIVLFLLLYNKNYINCDNLINEYQTTINYSNAESTTIETIKDDQDIFKENFKFEYISGPNQIIINASTAANIIIKDLKYGTIDEASRMIFFKDYNRITNLKPCTPYIITGEIYNNITNQHFSHTEVIKTSYSKPITNITYQIDYTDGFYIAWDTVNLECVSNFKTIIKSSHNEKIIDNRIRDREINDLDSCVNYKFQLQTYDINETLISNNTLESRTAYEDPGPIEIIHVKQNDQINSTYTVTWEKPENGSECVDYYRIHLVKLINLTDEINDEIDLKFGLHYNTTNSIRSFNLNNLEGCAIYQIKIMSNEQTTNNTKPFKFNTPIQTPGPVTNVKVNDITETNLTLTWDPPTINPDCVKNYLILKNNTEVTYTQNKSVFINDLDPCEIYTFQICVININNEKGPCVSVNAIMNDDKPSAVRNPVYNSLPNGNAKISWDVPEYGCKCVKHYRYVLWVETLQSINIWGETEFNYIELGNLTSCLSYTMQIIPVGHDKDGSLKRFEFTTDPQIFKPPSKPQLISQTSTSIELYTEYKDDQNMCEVLNGKFECRGFDNDECYDVVGTFIETHYQDVVNNLKPNSKYICTAQINNKAGWSNHSDGIVITTSEDLPDVPENVNINSITSSSFKITWDKPNITNGDIQKYHVMITLLNPNYHIPYYCDPIKSEKYDYVSNQTELLFDKALPFMEYFVQIAAENKGGLGEYTSPVPVTTKSGKPSTVKYLQYMIKQIGTNEYNASVDFTWKLPCRLNGELNCFEGYLIGMRNDEIIHKVKWTSLVNLKTNFTNENYNYTIENLKPELDYKLSIIVEVFNSDENSDESFIYFESPTGLPSTSNMTDWANKISENIPNPTENVIIEISKKLFSPENGQVLYLALLLSERGCQDDPIPKYEFIDSSNEWPNSSMWYDVKDMDCIPQYQTTAIRWNPLNEATLAVEKDENDSITFIIGNQNCDTKNKEYCNGPLKSGTSYAMVARIFTKAGYADSNVFIIETEKNIQFVIISISLVAVLSAGLIIGLIYFIFKQEKNIKDSEDSLKAIPDIQTKLPEENKIINIPFKPSNTPIHSPTKHNEQNDEFHFDKLSSEELEKAMKEYQSIDKKDGNRYSCSAAEANRSKNRYTNINPYDKNRVHLEGDTNYINASYINGYRYENEYIATQGPTSETSYDFWFMILQCKCQQIIMLTSLYEKGKEKCFKYFPDYNNEIKFRNIIIRNVEEFSSKLYLRRQFIVLMNDNEHIVYQYYFKNWLDHDSPANADDVLKFLDDVRSEINSDAPIVVHCSAGVGRTGTLIALDILKQKIKEENIKSISDVTIFETVVQLREQRMRMVQTESQYKFLYLCLAKYIINNSERKHYVKKRNSSYIMNSNELSTTNHRESAM